MHARRRALMLGLQDADPVVRACAAEALDRFELLQGLPQVLGGMAGFDAARWVELLRSLSGLRDETYLKLALRALGERAPEVRVVALEAIAEVGDWRATHAVSQRLADPDPTVRARAALTLGTLGDRRGAPALLPLLDDPEPEVRQRTAAALGALGHTAAEAGLLARAGDPVPEVRAAALAALGRIGLNTRGGAPPPG